MRKLTILLAAAVVASNAGCCGKIRNWFHKGSPCGTAMTPAVLGAPLAMGSPMMSSPVMTSPVMTSAPAVCCEQQPMCVPCNPCCDPCASGQMTSGYMGGYSDGGCCDGSVTTQGGLPMGTTTVVDPQPLQ